MGVRDFFEPSIGKAVFAVLLVIASMIPSSIAQFPNLQFDLISQLQLILLLPWYLFDLPALSVFGMILWVAYVYVIASIYVYAFSLIDAMLREEFPGINERWIKRRQRPLKKPAASKKPVVKRKKRRR